MGMFLRAILFGTTVAGLAGCAMEGPPSGKSLFVNNCVACHGADADGTGWVAAGLKRKPADLTGLSAGNGGVYPLAYVLSTIDGYHREKLPDSSMPEFGYIFGGDLIEVDTGDGVWTPVPEPLLAIAEYLETLQVEG